MSKEVEEAIAEAKAAEMIEEAKVVHAPKAAPTARDLSDKLGLGNDASRMSGAGTENPDRDESYVTVYSTWDNAPSEVLVSMLSKVIRKRFAKENWIPQDLWGRMAFSLKPLPDREPDRLNFQCMLNPQHPMRETLDELGLAGVTCTKTGIPTAVGADKHFKASHKDAYAVWEKGRTDAKEAAAIDRQERQLAAMLKLAEKVS